MVAAEEKRIRLLYYLQIDFLSHSSGSLVETWVKDSFLPDFWGDFFLKYFLDFFRLLYSLQIFFLTAVLSGKGNGNPGPRPESIMAPSAGRIRPTGPARGSLFHLYFI